MAAHCHPIPMFVIAHDRLVRIWDCPISGWHQVRRKLHPPLPSLCPHISACRSALPARRMSHPLTQPRPARSIPARVIKSAPHHEPNSPPEEEMAGGFFRSAGRPKSGRRRPILAAPPTNNSAANASCVLRNCSNRGAAGISVQRERGQPPCIFSGCRIPQEGTRLTWLGARPFRLRQHRSSGALRSATTSEVLR